MRALSLTGLLPSKTKKSASEKSPQKTHSIHLRAYGIPAPYTLRPFAGLYNPFPYGCSLLCNHPADNDARDVLRRAKDTWATEGKSLLLAEEIAAIRAGLEQITVNETPRPPVPTVESVPEELFRRYTETDSRPMTPAPTVISGYTRASGSRRCFTPDPIPTAEVRERTLLILDLRRSHSQDTISWHGSAFQHDTPLIRIHQAPTPSSLTTESFARTGSPSPDGKKRFKGQRTQSAIDKNSQSNHNKMHDKTYLEVVQQQCISVSAGSATTETNDAASETEEEAVKRRGKKRKKRGRDSSKGPPAFHQSMDPETQVSAAHLDTDSFNPSARGSLVPDDPASTNLPGTNQERSSYSAKQLQAVLDTNSYLDPDILLRLRRELTDEIIDLEFHHKKRIALQEAKKTLPPESKECTELKVTKDQLAEDAPEIDAQLFLTTPRLLSRSGVRFELPMDSRQLEIMTPLEYARDHCYVSRERKFLYNYVFNRNKADSLEEENARKTEGNKIVQALGEVMGKPLKETQIDEFRQIAGWDDEELYDFQTFCGLSGLCERYLGSQFCPPLPPKNLDRCHAVETADFESLHRRLIGLKPDERLLKILYHIRDK